MQEKTFTVALLGTHDPIQYSSHQLEFARVLGSHLARLGAVVATGSIPGFPLWGALGAIEVGGVSIGFSPASSRYEHEEHFRLPVDNLSSVVYTGFGLLGRDLIMIRSVDMLVVFLGDEKVTHELTLAKELQKPIIVVSFDHDEEKRRHLLGELYDYVEIHDSQESLHARLKSLIGGGE